MNTQAPRQASPRRTLSKLWTLVSLITVLACSLAQAQEQQAVPSVDPTREWQGSVYADVIFSEFQRLHPEIELVIDVKDIALNNTQQEWSLQQAAKAFLTEWKNTGKMEEMGYDKMSLRARFVSSFKESIPPVFASMAGSLEYGARINLARESTNEAQLAAWIDGKADRTVDPHELMIEALRLSNGHVIEAWATAWNLTREGWENAAMRNYSTVRTKMISITGEGHVWKGGAHYVALPESEWTDVTATITEDEKTKSVTSQKRMKMVITKRGDEFSYLYHRIGVELFSMITAKLTGSARLGWLAGTAGALGEFMKYKTTAGLRTENSKRINNDRLAAYSGSRFYQLVAGEATPTKYEAPPGAWTYMKSNPRKFGKGYQLPDGVPAQYFGLSVDKTFLADTMSVKELEMRFYHATHVDSIILEPIMLASTGEAERLHRGLVEYIKDGATNQRLNSFLQQWQAGVRASSVKDVKEDLEIGDGKNEEIARKMQADFDFDKTRDALLRLIERALTTAKNSKLAKQVKRIGGGALSCHAVFGQ